MVPPPTNPLIFHHGETVAALDARKIQAEHWVRLVARQAKAQVDWHYSGGVANVLHLGDAASRARVVAAMQRLEGRLKGHLMHIYEEGEPGLYRAGVTPVLSGVSASFIDLDTAQAAFI